MKTLTRCLISLVLIVSSIATALAQSAGSGGSPPRLFLDPGGHTSIVKQVLFTPDGRHVISVGNDKAIRVWNVATGKQIGVIYGQVMDGPDGKLNAAAIDPRDGKTLAVAGITYTGAKSDDPAKARFVIRIFHLDDLDSHPIAATLTHLLPSDSGVKGHADTILSLAFSPDGRTLASGSADSTVRLWDVASGKCTMLGGRWLYDSDHRAFDNEHTEGVNSISWSPDGKQIVSGSIDKSVRIWNADSGENVKTLDAKEDVSAVAWAPATVDGGKAIILGTVADDLHSGSIYAWNIGSGKKLLIASQEKPISCVSVSPDGRYLIAGQDIGAGGKCLARVWSIATGGNGYREIGAFDQHIGAVQTVAFSPDSSLVASGGNAGNIYLWHPSAITAGAVALAGTGGATTDVTWAAGDGKQLRWNSNGAAYIYDLPAALCETSAQSGTANAQWQGAAVTFTGGKRLGISDDNLAVTLNGGGSDLQFPPTPKDSDEAYKRNDFIKCYTFTPDGKYVVVGSVYGLNVYDARDGSLQRSFIGHSADVLSVAVSPDGRYLASSSSDQTVRIWSLANQEAQTPLLSVFADSDRNYVAWTPRGYYTCSPNGQSMIGWQRNQGDDARAAYDPAASFPVLRRPDVIAALWETGDIDAAINKVGAQSRSVDNLKPPTVDSLSVKEGQQVASTQLDISARIIPGSNALSSVQVSVNNQVQQPDALADVSSQIAARQPFIRHWSVKLKPGQDNTISVAAFDKPDDDQSQPMQSASNATVFCTAPKPPPTQPRLNVLAIGVSQYFGFEDLRYPDADAKGIVTAFKSQEGSPQEGKLFSHVATTLLTDKDATRANILTALQTLKATPASDDDYTIVFVAGHGGPVDAQHYYFLPYDVNTSVDAATVQATAVNWDDFYDTLKSLPGHVILLLDTCHSAGASDSTGGDTASAPRNNLNSMAYGQFQNNVASQVGVSHTSAVITLASCEPDQTSKERTDWGHGAFTLALLDALKTQDNPVNRPGDGTLTMKKLYLYVERRVEELTDGQQSPSLLANLTNTVNDLPIARVEGSAGKQTARR